MTHEISHKYLNHGTSVPIYKYSNNQGHTLLKGCILPDLNSTSYKAYSSKAADGQSISPDTKHINKYIKLYENAFDMEKTIYKENKGKSGIYLWTNKLTGEMYVGQSINLSERVKRYFNLSYLKSSNSLLISIALIKYGYINFSFTIIEYCDISVLNEREQYYLDSLNPEYNILKVAGSSIGIKRSEGTKLRISKALKGKYIGDKSSFFGRARTEETKKAMSLKKRGHNNPMYGKVHTPETIKLMSQKATGRKFSDETRELISKKHGNPVDIYEKYPVGEFKLIGSFISARRAGLFLGTSGSLIVSYIRSGKIYRNKYKLLSGKN